MEDPALMQAADWQPMLGREPSSTDIYVVRSETGTELFAAYRLEWRTWCEPQRDLRLFDVSSVEQRLAPQHRLSTWRELSTRELAKLSPTAQAWAAGFLPVGEAIPLGHE